MLLVGWLEEWRDRVHTRRKLRHARLRSRRRRTAALGRGGRSGALAADVELLEDRTLLSVSVPALTAPDSQTLDLTPTVVWTSVSGVEQYELHVYSTTFGRLLYQRTELAGTSHELDTPLAAPDTYQVFVRAADLQETGGWSAPLEFDLALPAAPAITGPASQTADTTPTVAWDTSEGAAAYHLQVYSVDRGRLQYEQTALTDTSHTLAAPLQAGETHEVFVRSINPEGAFGRWEPPHHFDVVLPEAPTIRAPGSTTVASTPTITWTPSEGAAAYDVEIYSTTRGRLIADASGLQGTAYHVSAPLESADTYGVYVRGVNPQGDAGQWSQYELTTTTTSTLSTTSSVNNPPWAEDDFYQILHDTSLNEPAPGVLWNDWDDDGDPLTAVLDTGPSNAASFTLYSDGGFDYQPQAGWTGTDSFTYHASDGTDLSNLATVWIDVTNNAPWAEDDFYQILHDTTLTEPAPGVMWNDWDDDGDPIYEPPPQWAGSDSFTYYVTDGIDNSNLATVWIDVTNNAPWAEDDFYQILHDTTLDEPAPGVMWNDWDDDGDPITAVLDTGPTHAVSFTFNADGSFFYEPPPQWAGSDSFTYYVTDGIDDSNLATVWIDVTKNAPWAEDDFYTAVYNTPLVVQAPGVLENDWDDDGDPIEAVPGQPPQYGSLDYLNSDGSFQYTPPDGFTGSDQFTYVADDGVEPGNEATVSIEVVRPTVDIDVDSNNDDWIDPEDDPTLGTDDPIEDDPNLPGQYIAVNDDDDNQNLEWDLNDTALVDSSGDPLPDDELVPAYLEIESPTSADPPDLTGFQIVVEASSDLRLWETQDKTGPLGTRAAWTNQPGEPWFPSVIYVEGYMPSTAEGAASLTMTLLNNEAIAEAIHSDLARATAIKADLDIDSDNSSGFNPPDPADDAEDKIEDSKTKPGKFIVANVHDKDNDGAIDYADFSNSEEKFVPLVLTVPEPIKLDKAKFQLIYQASDPEEIDLTLEDPEPEPGYLRVWTVDGNVDRQRVPVTEGGHYVAPGIYTAGDLDLDATRTVTFYVEGIRATGDFGDDRGRIELQVDPDGEPPDPMVPNAPFVHHDALRVTVINVDLDVDTDRDSLVTRTDETKEDQWSKGPGSRGAIALPNADKDNTTTKAPDNWMGGDWDDDGIDDPANRKVDDNNDAADLAPLWLPKLGPSTLPDDLKITLEASQPAGEHAYFANVDAEDRLRVFLPTKVNASDLEIQTDDDSVIGPEAGAVVEFVKNPTAVNQKSYDAFMGAGIVKFGVEGIEFGSEIDLTLTVTVGMATLAEDNVRIRVAPFVLLDHTTDVETAYVTETFTDPFTGNDNSDLVKKLEAHFSNPGELVKDTGDDPWQQDGYEIGYVRAPYGSMPVVLELPRADGGALQKFIRTKLLASDLAVNTRIEAAGTLDTNDWAGNIESIPLPNAPGKFFHGSGMHDFQTDFFSAQDVNEDLSVNTSWLTVKHVDEVVSVAPDGTHVVVADPEVAWTLLLWAASVDGTAKMHENMNGNAASGIAVGDVVDTTAGALGEELRQFNFGTVMHADNLPSIRTKVESILGSSPPESRPAADGANTGTGTLTKGGALVGFFANDKTRFYEIRFTNATDYELWYREDGTATWAQDPQLGSTAKDSVFKEARAFLLKHWWGGTPAAGDKFTFNADPKAKTLEMPVLFRDKPSISGSGADAYTTDHANSLVDGTTVITGDPYGPDVDYDGNGVESILDDYVGAMFGKAGYTNIITADARVYHDLCGSLHCGTNAKRSLPTSFDWWEK